MAIQRVAWAVGLLVALMVTPPGIAHGSESRMYVASPGAGVGDTGTSFNVLVLGGGEFAATHGHNRVTVRVTDVTGSAPYVVVCADVNANGVCNPAEGDFGFNNFGTVTMFSWSPVSRVIVFIYAAYVDEGLGVHQASTGTVTVTWG